MRRSHGFSLVELSISILVMFLTMSAVFHVLGKYQKSYQGEQIAADLHQGVRGAMELISQEIGQAGYFGFNTRYAQGAIVGGNASQTVDIVSSASIFVGERLLVDSGTSQELVTVTEVPNASSIKAVFSKSHAANTPINGVGAFPDGLLSTSTSTQLQLFGDMNADGTLVYVEYNCDLNAGTLTRSSTAISAATQTAPRVLLRNVVANPGGTACFQYVNPVTLNDPVVPGGTMTYMTEVWVTFTTRSNTADPETQQFRTMTSSLAVAPRNVVGALDLAQNNLTNRLQTKPPGLPLPLQ